MPEAPFLPPAGYPPELRLRTQRVGIVPRRMLAEPDAARSAYQQKEGAVFPPRRVLTVRLLGCPAILAVLVSGRRTNSPVRSAASRDLAGLEKAEDSL